MQNKSDLPDDKAKEMVDRLLEDPRVQNEILMKMKISFASWAVENNQGPEVEKLVGEFKVVLAACINAKTDVDPRNVLLALDYVTLVWAMGMVGSGMLELRNVENVVEPPVEAKEWKQ